MVAVKSFDEMCVEAQLLPENAWLLVQAGVDSVERMRFELKSEDHIEKFAYQQIRPFGAHTDSEGQFVKDVLDVSTLDDVDAWSWNDRTAARKCLHHMCHVQFQQTQPPYPFQFHSQPQSAGAWC